MTTEPRVFCIQRPTRRDPLTGAFEPTHDLTPAYEWGQLTFLLREGENPFRDPAATAELIRTTLVEQGFNSEDHLLLLGSPILIALAAVFACDATGRLRLLQWNSRDHAYRSINFLLFDAEDPADRPTARVPEEPTETAR